MKLVDVNVLVYAHRKDVLDHAAYSKWWIGLTSSGEAFGMSDLVLSGFLRAVTHPRIFSFPTSMDTALRFVEEIRSHPNSITIRPGEQHWEIFQRLCRATKAIGNLIPDAYLAALAMESGSEWITTDKDYARFPGLRWRHPLGA